MEEEIKGLSEHEAARLLKQYGRNQLADGERKSLLLLFLSQYNNLITYILLAAGIFSFFIHDVIDTFFIFLVVLLNGIFGFIQEYRAEKTLEKLRNLIIPQVHVVREGEELEIPASEIVPGDIVMLREGDRIPADGELISDVALEVDEAIFTGESLPVEKKSGDSLLSGTFIVQGRAQMRVGKTGMATRLGQIAAQIKGIKRPKTPLAQSLSSLGKQFALLAGILGTLLIGIGIIQGREFTQLALTAISIAVAMIPEGLPLVVTVGLAVGAYRMARAKAIVRKMAAIETLGSTNVILTDKTGTLTQNEMRVKKHWLPQEKNIDLLVRGAVLANTASFALVEDNGTREIIGDKTDGALLEFATRHVKDLEDYQKEGDVVVEKPFDPETKMIEVEWKNQGKHYEFIRGAPESVLQKIGKKDKAFIEKRLNEFAKQALRVIAFAYKAKKDKEFTFLGFLGIYDPPRTEAKEAIASARAAGIHVVMVTGDNPVTALSIAQELGLAEENDMVLIHKEVEKLSDEELLKILPRVRVFARMEPEDKSRLVMLYRKAGFVVAVTGDGVNDALALSEANIGVAMGKSGTDVAKEAADVIITDDNLATIVKAVEEGRGIFDNIVKVVVFLLASNLTEFLVIFLGILIGLPIPLAPTQILWINLIGDGIPAMALATDTKRGGLLNQKPRDITEHILNRTRYVMIAKITIPFSILLVALYYFALPILGEHSAQFLLFNVLIVGEMIIIFLIRGGVRPINKLLILSVVVIFLLQLIIALNPFLRSIFS